MIDSDAAKRVVHPIVRLNYIVRLVACPFVLMIVVSSRLGGGEVIPPGLWAALVLYAVAWPHVAYVLAKRTEEIRAREERFLLTDAAVAGIAIALASFRPVPTLVIITAILTILGSVGGVRLLVVGMSVLATTVLLTGSLVTDFAVASETPLLAELFSAATLLTFQTMMGLLTYRTARNIVATRRQIAYQADQIQSQNEQLVEAREEALQATKAKSAFLATMSHEIRTPLNGVLGMTRLLAETPLTPQQHDLLRTIQVSGNTLVTVINDILDYSKIESGRLDLEDEPLSLAQVVEESLEIVSERAREKGLELVCDVAPDVPEAILGDSTRLRQVVTNFVGNAVKFTEKGEVVVSARVLRAETPDDPAEIAFYVRDTGIGIPEDRIKLLFTPFSQADASTTRRYGGTGLGLAISKRLVSLMGGTVGVKSFVGQGTTFTFTIRARSAPSQLARRSPAPVRGKRVLVVDDNATNRRVLCGQLELWGLDPVGMVSAAQALESLREDPHYDLAILDYHMPDIDGMTLATEIRKLETTGSLPLILLSSSLVLSKDDPDRLFVSRLMKPARQSSLFDSIMAALGAETRSDEPRQSEPGLRPIGDSAPLEILVVDDNEINRNVAGLVLRRFGYESDFAVNGRDAVSRVAHRAIRGDESPYDLVFMDVQMPEMDGLEATRAIRRLEAERPSDRWPRIVAMTANALQEDRDLCLDAGMDDYLTKPLDFEAVQKVLRDASKALGNAGSAIVAPRVPGDTPTTADPGATLVDWARLDDLREYDTPDGAVVRGAIASLADQASARIEEIDRSLNDRNGDALRAAAHRLKGAAANIGAVRVADLASRLEGMGRAASFDEAEAVAAELADSLQPTLSQLQQYVIRAGGVESADPPARES
jgi:signal transduction histidine kinase/CheY-like chemotaxis protein/HPt (histidine-containing phosphotransfer) domain-containing protein